MHPSPVSLATFLFALSWSQVVLTADSGVTVQLFQWNWASVASECEKYLGPTGIKYAQVSPPAEHINGTFWYTDYQPISYIIKSKRGSRDAFKDMVTRCKAAGVEIMVDAVINHMSGLDTASVGFAGSAFDRFEYPGIYDSSNFHRCRADGDYEIKDYTSRFEVQNCELVSLSDLATEQPAVRSQIAAYLKDLVSLGVTAFRVDAAKHIPSDDIRAILDEVSTPVYLTQEMIQDSSCPILPDEYVQNGAVQEFRSAWTLKDAFTTKSISILLNEYPGIGWVASESATSFVANHDTERNLDTLSAVAASNAYQLATIFLLAHPYGSPAVLSSYVFPSGNTGQGPPQKSDTMTLDTECGVGTWRCEHRSKAIVNMIGFRSAAGDGAIVNQWNAGSSRIAFGRGKTGFVLINNEDSEWSISITVSVPDGTYCDLISDTSTSSLRCTSTTAIVVKDTVAAVVVPARGAIAFSTAPSS